MKAEKESVSFEAHRSPRTLGTTRVHRSECCFPPTSDTKQCRMCTSFWHAVQEQLSAHVHLSHTLTLPVSSPSPYLHIFGFWLPHSRCEGWSCFSPCRFIRVSLLSARLHTFPKKIKCLCIKVLKFAFYFGREDRGGKRKERIVQRGPPSCPLSPFLPPP